MRIMLDTNVLLSIAAFRSSNMAGMLNWICLHHELVLSSYVVDECYEVVRRKKPALVPALDRFFDAIPFETFPTPKKIPEGKGFVIRDKDDEKVLYSAVAANADILITGDKDFADVRIDKPAVMTPRAFIQAFMQRS